MKSTMKHIAFGVSLAALVAAAAAPAAGARHKFCVPEGTKLGKSCQTHGYSHGARAHFKADRRAEHRAEMSHHSAKKE